MPADRVALGAALLAALCWAIGGVIAMNTTMRVGAVSFNRWRMFHVFWILLICSYFFSYGRLPVMSEVWLLVLSGFIGIFVGDTALFFTLSRMGPRRTSIMFALHAPFTALLGLFILSEYLTWTQSIGVVLTFIGISIAVLYGKRADMLDIWEENRGNIGLNLCVALLAALSHALGALVARPVMSAGVDPLIASTLRVAGSVVCYFMILLMPYRYFRARESIGYRGMGITVLSGCFGMVIGASLYLYALSGADAGIVASLASLSPVLMLPLLWIRNGYPPSALAWVGAILASCGATLIFY